MAQESRVVSPGPRKGTVRLEDGRVVQPPSDWALLPPGDAGLTRRVKKEGPSWTVVVMKRRRKTSQGVWAPADVIARHRRDLEEERSTETYAKRQASAARRRDAKQVEYVADFERAVLTFLDFHLTYDEMARVLARRVAEHATPVGSGTVARTQRIPVEQRAEAAVIAWLRHQTSNYDDMKLARVKGRRREVRRMLAEQSRALLDSYRRGDPRPPGCPLHAALSST